MPIQQTTNEKPTSVDLPLVPSDEQQFREMAVAQIERKRRFRVRAVSAAVVGVALVVIWAIAEYHNAAADPRADLVQSSASGVRWTG